MDELDRMFRLLVQNVRASLPDLLTRPFEVSLIYQQIIPYRLNRRELGLGSNDEYELTLLQLLSGARGLLAGDEEMQRALRAELESPNPDLGAYRAYATSTVQLQVDALRSLDSQPRVRSVSPGPAPERPAAAAQAVLAARATEEVAVPASAPRPQRKSTATPKATRATSSAAGNNSAHHHCRYCGGELPDGRDLNFCPHCGQNLTIKQCPACSTELDLSWRYCVTCGRQVE